MDFLKLQLDRIQKQLAGLTATQRMLTASLVAIMIITVVWWGKYASEAETVELLKQSFSASDLGRIEERLDLKNIKYTVSGDKILVPADRRMEILADLTYARMLPQNTQEGFEDMIKQMTLFDSSEKQEKIWNHGKEVLLSRLIGNFPDVTQADVVIDPTRERKIAGDVEPGATVFITLREGQKVQQRLVDAAAEAVAGAQGGLKVENVKVIVNGAARRPHDSANDPLEEAPQQLAMRLEAESAYVNKIRETYSDIPGLHATVNVRLNTTSIQTDKTDYDLKNSGQKETQTSTETEETTGSSGSAGGEAGAQPNTSLAVGPSGGGSQSQTREKTDTRFQVIVPETHTLSKTPAGDTTPVSASVRVPLGHFVRLYKSLEPATKDPTYKQMQPFIEQELQKMQLGVASCVMLQKPTDVSITTYLDDEPAALAPVTASSSLSIGAAVTGHAKEVAIGGLAVMSLFMASMMVRKSSPAPVPAVASAAAQPIKSTAVLSSGEGIAGEAGDSDAPMEGMELDDESVRARRMVDQVSTMVQDNPEAAAALVKRWLNRS